MTKRTADSPAAYERECRRARRIAAAEPGCALHMAFAEAIADANGRNVHILNGVVAMTYHNGFGPTCAVDEQIERMDMAGWAAVAANAVALVLGRAGDPIGRLPSVRPTVALTPEEDSDVVRQVTLLFRAKPRLLNRLVAAVETLYDKDGGCGRSERE